MISYLDYEKNNNNKNYSKPYIKDWEKIFHNIILPTDLNGKEQHWEWSENLIEKLDL